MWKVDQKVAAKVDEVLQELGGICPRCVLRCQGVKNSSIIRDAGEKNFSNISGAESQITPENSDNENIEEPPKKKAKVLPCRLCLGLLEERYMESALKSVSLQSTYSIDQFVQFTDCSVASIGAPRGRGRI